jgi:hypothetical protein
MPGRSGSEMREGSSGDFRLQPCAVKQQLHCLGWNRRLWPRDDKAAKTSHYTRAAWLKAFGT